VSLLTVVTVFSSASLPAPDDCGNCDLPVYWEGVSTGAYKFADGVPDHVKDAAFWSEDGGWGQYYDPNDPNAITVEMYDHPNPDVTGEYNANSNTLRIDETYSSMCSSACNHLIGTFSHEFGHAFGFWDFEQGCEESIMSYANDFWYITHPSEEDLCWWANWGDGPDWECPEYPCIPYRKVNGGGGGGLACISQ
jgi:hypothetical protein